MNRTFPTPRIPLPLWPQLHVGYASFLLWLPIVLLFSVPLGVKSILPPWAFMWTTAISIFFSLKWWAWRQVIRKGIVTTTPRSLAFLFLWPGMDAERFLSLRIKPVPPQWKSWFFAIAKTGLGALLLWGLARLAGNGLFAGWMGMIGLIFLLHFGIFHLLALFWQSQGIYAPTIMRWPILANSLTDFWGNRWNAGFRDLAFGLVFTKLVKVMPPKAALLVVFLVSGLIHELVITVPIGASYGLPTCYFTLQGLAMLLERSQLIRAFRRSIATRIFAILVISLPIGWLFPPQFVLRTMVPFFQFIQALP